MDVNGLSSPQFIKTVCDALFLLFDSTVLEKVLLKDSRDNICVEVNAKTRLKGNEHNLIPRPEHLE